MPCLFSNISERPAPATLLTCHNKTVTACLSPDPTAGVASTPGAPNCGAQTTQRPMPQPMPRLHLLKVFQVKLPAWDRRHSESPFLTPIRAGVQCVNVPQKNKGAVTITVPGRSLSASLNASLSNADHVFEVKKVFLVFRLLCSLLFLHKMLSFIPTVSYPFLISSYMLHVFGLCFTSVYRNPRSLSFFRIWLRGDTSEQSLEK